MTVEKEHRRSSLELCAVILVKVQPTGYDLVSDP